MEAWGPRCTTIRAFTKRGKPKASSSMGENRHKVLRAHDTLQEYGVWNPLELSAPSGLESCGVFSRHLVKQRKVNPIASVPRLETCRNMIWIQKY